MQDDRVEMRICGPGGAVRNYVSPINCFLLDCIDMLLLDHGQKVTNSGSRFD
jgi:hypothetical protein